MNSKKRHNKKEKINTDVSAFTGKLPVEDIDPLIGKRIGSYELQKELGRGGMGAVYLATRADGEFSQRVAVKFIKRGMDTDFIVRSFRKERQILADLEHPFIARLLDGGTNSKGLPYLVMEFVEGKPLYQYCDAQKMDIDGRLRIFQQICSAVAYAHERKIIHRDLKPGNIIITDSGNPKLLDFGIAKMLDPDSIHESINPVTQERIMTFDYASPEQITGGEITAASDVYSLGVILYELLTGHNLYKKKNRSPYEISRAVCEEIPELPSRIVSENEYLLPLYEADEITAEKAAELRGSDIQNLENDLAGNLDLIVMKALAKSPDKRFPSVKEFSDDIERYLSGTEVLAKPVAKTEEVFTKHVFERATDDSKSIAVLPLRFLNPVKDTDTGDHFLGLGLADTLITRLSNVQRFIVRPTGSILRYSDKTYDSFTAGRELGVEYILDGTILKSGERLRVSVQLLKISDKSTIWAERFDEKTADVLHLEDVISSRVAESLIPRLTAEERGSLAKRGTDNREAFEMYMRGRAFWNSFTPDGFAKAIELHEKAVALDPNYAIAYAGLADNYNWLGVYGVLPPFECFQKAQKLSLKAIEIDEDLSDAHAALGFAVVAGGYDWARGEAENCRALELNPNNATAHVWYSLQLFMEGRFAEGEYHARRGAELDPLTPYNVYNVGWCLYFARRYEDSIAQFYKTIAAFPAYPLGFYGLSWTSRIIGDYQTAIEAAQKTLGFSGETQFNLTMLAQTHAAAGNRKIAADILENLRAERAEKFVSPYHLALIYCFLGEKENALDELENSLEDKEAWIVWMGVEPVFEMLHGEERFLNLLETTGNPNLPRIKSAYQTPETSFQKSETDDLQENETNEILTAPVSETKNNFVYPAVILGILFLVLSFAAYYFFSN